MKLIEHGLVKALADAVGRRMLGLRPRVVDVLHGQVQLVGMPIGRAAVFGAAVSEHALQRESARLCRLGFRRLISRGPSSPLRS